MRASQRPEGRLIRIRVGAHLERVEAGVFDFRDDAIADGALDNHEEKERESEHHDDVDGDANELRGQWPCVAIVTSARRPAHRVPAVAVAPSGEDSYRERAPDAAPAV